MKTVVLGTLSLAFLGCSGSDLHECTDKPGTACTWAGVAGIQGKDESVHDRRETLLNWPTDIGFSPTTDRGYIVDWNNHLVRRVEADDTIINVLGNAVEAEGAPDGADYLPPSAPVGAPGESISLNHPTDLAFLPDGRMTIASWHGLRVRVWDPDTHLARVIAGNGQYGNVGDEGPAHSAEFNLPRSIASDANGRLYVLDQKNQRVREFDANPTSLVKACAGVGGTPGFSGDGGPARDAKFWFVTSMSLPSGGLTVDGDHLYISDNGNNRIRRVNLATEIIDTIAGNGTAGFSGDGGSAMDASFNSPAELAIGPDGRLYIADSYNNVVRRLDLTTGIIETIAGTGAYCAVGTTCIEAHEGMPAREITLNGPLGLGFDRDGHLYIADTYNNRIVRVARDW